MSLVPGQRQLGAPARKQCPKSTYQLIPGLVQHWAVPCRVRQTCGQIGFYRHRDTANVLVAVTACTLHSCAPIKWGCLCLDLIHLSSFVLHGFSGIMCPSVGDTTASSHKAWGQVPAPPQATGETREMCCHCDNCPGEGWGHLCPTCTVTTPTELTVCPPGHFTAISSFKKLTQFCIFNHRGKDCCWNIKYTLLAKGNNSCWFKCDLPNILLEIIRENVDPDDDDRQQL